MLYSQMRGACPPPELPCIEREAQPSALRTAYRWHPTRAVRRRLHEREKRTSKSLGLDRELEQLDLPLRFGLQGSQIEEAARDVLLATFPLDHT